MKVLDRTRRARPHRLWLATVGALVAVMGLAPLPGTAESSGLVADLTAEIIPVGPQYYGFEHRFEIRVTNTGSEPFVDLTFVAQDPGACEVVEGPVEESGNADDVLDPAEVWVYTCSAEGPSAIEGIYWFRMTLTARTAGNEEVTVSFRSPDFQDSYPVSITVIEPLGQLQIEPGSTATWTFDATNTSELTLEASAEVLLFEESRDFVGAAPASFQDPGGGDDVFDPGETWRGSYSVQLDTEGVYFVFIDVHVVGGEPIPGETRVRRGELDSSGGPVIVAHGAPSSTTAAVPTNPPAGESALPATGSSTSVIALLAAALVVFGAIARLLGRRPERSTPPH